MNAFQNRYSNPLENSIPRVLHNHSTISTLPYFCLFLNFSFIPTFLKKLNMRYAVQVLLSSSIFMLFINNLSSQTKGIIVLSVLQEQTFAEITRYRKESI